MFKGFQNTSRTNGFNGFVSSPNFQMNNEAYGISSCIFWLDAAVGTNTQTNLGAISSWRDKFFPYSFIQNTVGNQPRYISSDVAYNNYPVVEFQDINRGLRVSPTTSKILGIQTIAFVANYNTINTRNLVFGDFANGNAYGVGLGGSVAIVTGPYMRTTVAETSATTETTTVKICVFSENLIMVNGVVESTATNNFKGFTFDAIGYVTNSANSLDGKVAEIIAYSKSIDSTQASNLSSIINSKYAIY